jgi:hypothetical protein
MRAAEWEPNCDSRADSNCARNGDIPTVQAHQFLHEREPDARALLRPGASALDTVKPLEEARQFMLGNTDTGISDYELGHVANSVERDDDFSFECEFEGVRQQIQNDLLPHLTVDEHWLNQFVALHSEPETSPFNG